MATLRRLPFAEVGDTLVDHHRTLRQGMPEAIYGRGKSLSQCSAIVGELMAHGSGPVLLTRVSDEIAAALLQQHPGGEHRRGLRRHSQFNGTRRKARHADRWRS